MKIANSLDLGELKSQEEARQKGMAAMSKMLNGKSFDQVVTMAGELPDDPKLLKAFKEMESMGTTSEYQHDADIVRLKHLKYLGALIEEFKEANGHYPLQSVSPNQNYVHIASHRQLEHVPAGPPHEHTKTDIEKFTEILETGLRRKIDLPFDPQLVPVNKPNFYMYMIQGNRYFLAVHVHDGEGIGNKLGPHYYKAEISNIAIPERNVFTYDELLVNQAFLMRINENFMRGAPKNPDQAEIDL